jgi:hypothetical protein
MISLLVESRKRRDEKGWAGTAGKKPARKRQDPYAKADRQVQEAIAADDTEGRSSCLSS